MTDPRIRYDILANAQGEEDVRRLAAELEKLDDSLDPETAAKAKLLAQELQTLGRQSAELDAFQRALVDANEAGRRLEASSEALRRLREQLQGVNEPTRKQAGDLQRLIDREKEAQSAYTASTTALASARVAVERLGVSTGDLAGAEQRLAQSLSKAKTEASELSEAYQRNRAAAEESAAAARQLEQATARTLAETSDLAKALRATDLAAANPAVQARAKALNEELGQLNAQLKGLEAFNRLKRESDEAAQALTAAQQAAQKLGREIAATTTPTRAQTGEFERLRDAVNKAELELKTKTQATIGARAELAKLGVSTSDLAATNVRLEASTRKVREEVTQLGQQGSTLQAFSQLVRTTEEARARFDQADVALEAYRRELQGVAEPTLAQQRLLARLNEEARQSQQAFQTASLAQAQQATALRAAGVDTDRLVAAQQRLPPQLTATAAAARQVASSYGAAGSAAAASAAQQQAANNSVAASLQGLRGQLQTLQNLAAVAIGGGAFGGVIRDVTATADAYANLQARIRLVTGEGADFERGFEGVFDVSRRTNVALEETGTLFARLTQTGRDAGLSAQAAIQQSLALTESINQATVLSGGNAESARAAITQLIQGLQSGVLRGEEFNSVVEQTPRLARALAQGLNATTGELRELANAGALTTDIVLRALESQSATLQREFDQLPLTVGRAIQGLSTEWTRYIGEVDQANGISAKAAEAIGFLSRNLSEIASAVSFAGQAWLAYKALNLAATFTAQALAQRNAAAAQVQETGARVAATAAAADNTRVLVANTGAKTANAPAATALARAEAAAAAAGAAGSGGLAAKAGALARVGGAAGLAGGAVLLFGGLLNDLGILLGEGAAKLAGYSDSTEELEQAERQAAEASRASAAAKAEYAAKLQLAEDKARGLTKQSRDLIQTFEGVIEKGGSAAESVEKLAKALQIDSPQGLRDAVSALAELERRGVFSAEQVQRALGEALSGRDLRAFETTAKAVFGSFVSTSGTSFERVAGDTERLALVTRTVLNEALRRTGVDLGELTTGFSAAATSAINDVDTLTEGVETLRSSGIDTGRALSASLDKALAAANTEQAVQAVIVRIQRLGQAGILSGDQFTSGLEKARKKLDELKPGINTLDEALRQFGLKTRTELQATADKLEQAYLIAAASGKLSLDEQAKAYLMWREVALQASGGVETGQLRLQRVLLENKGAFLGVGEGAEQGMDRASKATKKAGDELLAYQKLLRETRALTSGGNGAGGIGPSQDGQNFGVRSPGGTANELPAITAANSIASRGNSASGFLPVTREVAVGQAVNKPSSGNWVYTLSNFAIPGVDANGRQLAGGWAPVRGPSGVSATPFAGGASGGFLPDPFGRAPSAAPAPSTPAPQPPAPAPSPAPSPASAPPVLGRYEIVLNGTSVFADSQAAAEAFLRELENGRRTYIGP